MMCFAKNVFEQERGFKQYHELILSTILNLCQPLYNSRSKSLSMTLNTANIFHKEIYSIWLDIKGYNYSLCLTFCLYRVKKWCCRKIWHSLTDQIRVVLFAHVERFKNDPFPNFSFQALHMTFKVFDEYWWLPKVVKYKISTATNIRKSELFGHRFSTSTK